MLCTSNQKIVNNNVFTTLCEQISSSQMLSFRRNVGGTKSYEEKGKNRPEKNFSKSIGDALNVLECPFLNSL